MAQAIRKAGLLAAICLIACCMALVPRAYASDLARGITTQALGPRVSVCGGAQVELKAGATQTFEGGAVTCTLTNDGKVIVTLKDATLGQNDSSSSDRLMIAQTSTDYPVTIELVGANVMTSKISKLGYGINAYGASSVTLTGTGSLAFDTKLKSSISWGRDAVSPSDPKTGTLTVDGPTIDAAGQLLGDTGHGQALVVKKGSLAFLYGGFSTYKQLGGTVAATGGEKRALYAKSFQLKGGTLKLAGTFSALQAKSFAMTGGALSATGAADDAIYVSGKLSVTGGKITAKTSSSRYALYGSVPSKVSVKASCLKKVSGLLGPGVSFKASGNTYKVTKAAKKTFTVTLTSGANAKTASVNSAKIGGVTYKVSAIGAKAFAKRTKLTGVTLGANVKTIGASAFTGCAKLKTLTVKSTKLTAKSVKGSLSGSKIVTVKVPAKKLVAYKGIFTKSNAGKAVKVAKA